MAVTRRRRIVAGQLRPDYAGIGTSSGHGFRWPRRVKGLASGRQRADMGRDPLWPRRLRRWAMALAAYGRIPHCRPTTWRALLCWALAPACPGLLVQTTGASHVPPDPPRRRRPCKRACRHLRGAAGQGSARGRSPCHGRPLHRVSKTDAAGRVFFGELPPADYYPAVLPPEEERWLIGDSGRRTRVTAGRHSDIGTLHLRAVDNTGVDDTGPPR